MDINNFTPKNLLNIKQPVNLLNLNNQQVYELQVLLEFLEYKTGPLDGVLGNKTREAFINFKKDTFQVDPHLIGPGSIEILLKLLDKEKDLIEKEANHPQQPQQAKPNKIISVTDINWSDFSSPISKYFSVGEVTRFDRQRIPQNDQIKFNIIKLAQELDKVREAWGKPIGVTSWYRPPAVNRRIGGAKFSQHLNGSAADIYHIGGNGREFEKWLDSFWGNKALGYGQRSGRGFTHVDLRTGRIRWNY